MSREFRTPAASQSATHPFSRRSAFRAAAAGAALAAVSTAGCTARPQNVTTQAADAVVYNPRGAIDVEAAWLPGSGGFDDLAPALDSAPNNLMSTRFIPALKSIPRRTEAMDQHGIATMILSMVTAGIQAEPVPATAVNRARQLNDLLAEVVRANPGRFAALAAVPLQDPAAAAEEVRRCVTDLGMVGVLYNSYSDLAGQHSATPDTGEYDVFWSAINDITKQRGGHFPVYLHPRQPPSNDPPYYGNVALQGATWMYNESTAAAMLGLCFGGVFDRFPAVQVIAGHAGEGLPGYWWRSNHKGFLTRQRGNAVNLHHRLPYYLVNNFWYTTSGVFDDTFLWQLAEVIGAAGIAAKHESGSEAQITEAVRAASHEELVTLGLPRTMFAIDDPFEDAGQATQWLASVPMAAADKAAFAYGTTRQLFRLT
jgi:2,3-dihydroxybenzoate decarboxylase